MHYITDIIYIKTSSTKSVGTREWILSQVESCLNTIARERRTRQSVEINSRPVAVWTRVPTVTPERPSLEREERHQYACAVIAVLKVFISMPYTCYTCYWPRKTLWTLTRDDCLVTQITFYLVVYLFCPSTQHTTLAGVHD